MGFAALWGTGIVSYIVGMGLVFWLGWRMVGDGRLTIGTVYLIFHYTEMIRHPMDQIREQMADLQKAGAGIERVEELFATAAATSTPPAPRRSRTGRCRWTFDHTRLRLSGRRLQRGAGAARTST